MKARKSILLFCTLFLVSAAAVKAEGPVVFNDPALEGAVRQALNIPTDPIMPADMLNLTDLYAGGRGIADLTGLECATNLTVLILGKNNNITDLSPLAGLTALEQLDLVRNQINNVSPLSGLSSLSRLSLSDNQISDISPLSQLTNLTSLDVSRNPFTDINPLVGLANLQILRFESTAVTDISRLAEMAGLYDLTLGGNPQISDFSVVGMMPNLQCLRIGTNPIADFSFLAGMTGLVELQIHNSQVSDISVLAGLPNLQRLNLARTQITDLSLLSEMTGLTVLWCGDNPQITDWSVLSCLSNLEGLTLERNQITDISFVANMSALRQLDLRQNKVSDISVLAGLTSLENLTLSSNNISDLQPISALTTLRQLDLRANPLNADACTTYIPYITEHNPGIQIQENACFEPGENILVNGGFESGAMSPWWTGTTPPVVITAGVVHELTGATVPEGPIEGSSCLRVVVSETSASWWDAVLRYHGLVFQAGKKYTLSAFLKCKEGTLRINFKAELTGAPYTGYGERQFTMTDEWAEYSLTTPVFVSNVLGELAFHIGFAPGEFWMDDVHLIGEDGPLPKIVHFADQNLKQAVKDALGITTDPTDAQMATLTQLWAHNKGISDLTGIEYAVNLTHQYMNDNQVSNLSPLAGLTNLQVVFLQRNRIGDITPLAGLTDLVELWLDNNQVSDISALAEMTKLTTLYLCTNQIGDLGPLSRLTNLTTLELWSNQIADVSPLTGLTSLTKLNLGVNQISDVAPLAALTNLPILVLTKNQISDLTPLSGLTNLTELTLWSNQITDISPLAGLTNLTLLTLGKNQISVISPLAGLVNLTELQLSPNQISDLTPLSALTNLGILELGSNQISNLSPLSGLTSLTRLTLGTNQISDVSPLAGLTNLTVIGLESNQISDLGPLSGLVSLIKLGLNDNQISTLSPLAGLTNLTALRLPNNPISDISPLAAVTTLKECSLTGCPLSWQSYCLWLPIIQANNPALTNLKVDPNPYNCQPEPTPEGSGVGVTPTDSTTGTTPVTMTFEQVAAAGATILMTSGTGPTPPAGFQLGDPATFYEITTSASYTGLIDVCVSYGGVSYQGPPEALRLMHYENGQWVDCTTVVDTENQRVCGVVTSLSPFAIMAPEDATPPVFESLVATPSVLWPPNHKMVPITVTCNVTDNLDPNPTVVLKGITTNEGDRTSTYDPEFDTTIGHGHTTNDIQVNADGSIWLRAERSGTNTGRTYTLTYQATDSMGNTATKTVIVTVPHNAP